MTTSIFTRLESLRLAMVTAKLDLRRTVGVVRNEHDNRTDDEDDGSYAYANNQRMLAQMQVNRGAPPPKGTWCVYAGKYAECDDDAEKALARLEKTVASACRATLETDIKTAREMLAKAEAARRRLDGE